MVQHLEQVCILLRLLEVGRMQMCPRIRMGLKQVLDAQAIINARLAVLKVDYNHFTHTLTTTVLEFIIIS